MGNVERCWMVRRADERYPLPAWNEEQAASYARAGAEVVEYVPASQQEGAVGALVAADLLADAVFDEVPQRTLEAMATEFRALYARAGGQ